MLIRLLHGRIPTNNRRNQRNYKDDDWRAEDALMMKHGQGTANSAEKQKRDVLIFLGLAVHVIYKRIYHRHFPGAEGGGMYMVSVVVAVKVITVTNLNDRGPGSFRDLLAKQGRSYYRVQCGGYYPFGVSIMVRAPYVTIFAGQTAPGMVFVLPANHFEYTWCCCASYAFPSWRNKVWHRDDSFGEYPISNIMIDHCSCSWGLDEIFLFYHRYVWSSENMKSKDLKLPTVNVTIQNTISTAKALDTYNHAFGSTLGGENCAFARNLWASNAGRNPSIGWMEYSNFVNNVVFNWVHRSSDGGDYTTNVQYD